MPWESLLIFVGNTSFGGVADLRGRITAAGFGGTMDELRSASERGFLRVFTIRNTNPERVLGRFIVVREVRAGAGDPPARGGFLGLASAKHRKHNTHDRNQAMRRHETTILHHEDSSTEIDRDSVWVHDPEGAGLCRAAARFVKRWMAASTAATINSPEATW